MATFQIYYSRGRSIQTLSALAGILHVCLVLGVGFMMILSLAVPLFRLPPRHLLLMLGILLLQMLVAAVFYLYLHWCIKPLGELLISKPGLRKTIGIHEEFFKVSQIKEIKIVEQFNLFSPRGVVKIYKITILTRDKRPLSMAVASSSGNGPKGGNIKEAFKEVAQGEGKWIIIT